MKDNKLLTFIKGFIIGLGIIFPISASGLAVSMGLYERLLNIINNIKKSLKEELGFIIPFFIGVVASAVVSIVMINYTYKMYPVPTLFFFEGLILGGFHLIVKKTNKEWSISNFLCLFVGIVALVSISLCGSSGNVILGTSLKELATLFLVGAVAAGSMIIPGVSGSLILVILGYYEPLLALVSDTLHFHSLTSNMLMVIIFMIGMVIGILIVSKIMDIMLKKYQVKSYFAIVGFILASVINILILIIGYKLTYVNVIIGLMLFELGYLVSYKFLKEE